MILEPMKDLGTVLNKFLDTQKLLASPEILERITFEAAEDVFLNEGVKIVEFRYAPTFIQMGHEHMSFEQIHEAIVKGEHLLEPGLPESFNVLVKELQSLALNVELIEQEDKSDRPAII